MAVGGDDLALSDLVAADGAVGVAGVAFLGAGSFLGVTDLGFAVAVSGDDLALGDQLAAIGAVGVAGVAFLSAGGFLSVTDLGIGMGIVDSNGFLDAQLVVVDLFIDHSDRFGVSVLDLEVQSSDHIISGVAVQLDIAQSSGAFALVDGGVVSAHSDLDQLQSVGVPVDSGNTVGEQLFAQSGRCCLGSAGSDGNGDVLFLLTNHSAAHHGLHNGGSLEGLVLDDLNNVFLNSGISRISDHVHGAQGLDLSLGSSQILSGDVDRINTDGVLAADSIHGIDGSAVLSNAGQSCGPNIGAEVAVVLAQEGAFSIVEVQVVQLVGFAGEGREVQVVVVSSNQGAEHITVRGAGEGKTEVSHVGLPGIQLSGEAGFGCPDVQIQQVAVVVHQDQVLGNGDLVAFAIDVIFHDAQRGDAHKVGGTQLRQDGAQIECAGVQSHGILAGQDIVVVESVDNGSISGGEDGAVLHIPHGNAGVIASNFLDLAGSGVDLVHGSAAHGVDIDLVVQQVGGSGTNGAVEGSAGSPGAILFHVPAEELSLALFVLQDAVDGDSGSGDGHDAGCREVGIQVGGCGDGDLAGSDSGDNTVLIDSGDGIIGGGPGDGTVSCGPGSDDCGQSSGAAAQQGQGLGSDLDAGNLIGGVSPVAAGGLVGDQQSAQLIGQVSGLGEGAVCHVDLDEVRVISLDQTGGGAESGPAQVAGVGIDLHSLHISRLIGEGSAQLHGCIQGIQSEGVDFTGAVLVGVEGAVGIAGQGVGVEGQFASQSDLTGQLVDGDQNSTANGVDLAVNLVVSHVGDSAAQVADHSHIGQVFQRHDMQLAGIGSSEDIVVNDGTCVVSVVGRFVLASDVSSGSGDALEGGPEASAQVEGDSAGQDDRLILAAQVDLVGGGVQRIVRDLQQELAALDFAQIQNVLSGFAGFDILLGADIVQSLSTLLVVQDNSGDILVIGSGNGQSIAGQAQGNILQGRSGVIHDHRHGEGSALAQGIPVHIAFCVNVVLGNQGQANFQLGVVGQAIEAQVSGQCPAVAIPVAAVDIVVSTVNCAHFISHYHFAGGSILHEEEGSVSITDSVEGDLADLAGSADRVTLGHVGSISDHGVATEEVVGGIACVQDGQSVCGQSVKAIVNAVQVGSAGLQTVLVLHSGALVEHGGVSPVAVEAQHGDGVGSTHDAFLAGNAVSIDIALEVSTVGVIIIDSSLPVIGDLDLNDDFHAAAGRNSGNSLSCGQEQVSVEGVDVAIVVQVSLVSIGQLGAQAGSVVQESLAVQLVDSTVAIEVQTVHTPDSANFLAINGEGGQSADQSGGGVHIHIVTVAGGSLDEEVSGQVVQLVNIIQVVDGEGEAVLAGLVGIVAQLSLDLAVGVGLGCVRTHHQVGVSHDSGAHIAQAGALLQDRIVAAGRIQHGDSGGHQQALDQLAGSQTGKLFQAGFLDILCQNGCHTSNLRRCHGGTGHDLVLVMSSVAISLVGTVDGQDVAARCSDLRLHDQGAGNAPGREAGHGVVVIGVHAGSCSLRDSQSAGPTHHFAVLTEDLVDLEDLTGGQGNGNSGSIVFVTGQVHAKVLINIVDDDDSNCIGCDSSVGLLEEGGLATVAHSDLAFQCAFAQGSELLGSTDVVQEDVLIVACQSGERLVAVGAATLIVVIVIVEHAYVTHHDDGRHTGNEACVVNGGNAHGVGEGSGRAVGLHADIISVQVAGVGLFCPVAGVTGGHSNHNTGLGQAFHNGLIFSLGASGTAGVAGAQRQVDGVSAQNDGVFDSGHVVGIISAALLAEDLHGDQLCVGSNTLHENTVQSGSETAFSGNEGVSGSDAGNVGAVLALLVVQVGDIVVLVNIVVAEGHLAVDVGFFAGEADVQLAGDLFDLSGSQQIQRSSVFVGSHTGQTGTVSQRILISSSIEGDVIDVRTGIDDGDTGAGTGVTCSPGGNGAGLGAGGCHVGIGSALGSHIGLVAGLDQNLLNAVNGFDGFDLTVSNIGGNDVGSQRQIPDNIQILAGGLFDLGSDLILILLQVVAVCLDKEVGSSNLHIVACFQHTFLLKENGNTNHLIGGIGILFFCQVSG